LGARSLELDSCVEHRGLLVYTIVHATPFLNEEPSKPRVELNAGIVREMRFDKGCQLDDCAHSLEIKCTGESDEVILALV
jgi:hypothetical protein